MLKLDYSMFVKIYNYYFKGLCHAELVQQQQAIHSLQFALKYINHPVSNQHRMPQSKVVYKQGQVYWLLGKLLLEQNQKQKALEAFQLALQQPLTPKLKTDITYDLSNKLHPQ